jgi:hypothetical protein
MAGGTKHILFDFLMHDGVSSPLTMIIGKWVGLNNHILNSQNLIKGLGVAVAAAGILKAGEALEKGAIALAKANATANHPYFQMQMAGIPQGDAAYLRNRARLENTPGLDFQTRMKLVAETKSLYGAGPAATKEAGDVLPALAKATATIRDFNPTLSLDEASEQAFQILRARDATGKLTDAHGNIIQQNLNAQMAQGLGYYLAGGMTGDDQMTMVKRMKGSRMVLDTAGEDSEYAIQKVLGPAASGTMFSTFVNSIVGSHATDQAKRNAVALGWASYAPDLRGGSGEHHAGHGRGSASYGDDYSSSKAHGHHRSYGKGNYGSHVPPIVANPELAEDMPHFLLSEDPQHKGQTRYQTFLNVAGIKAPMDGTSQAALDDQQRFKREMATKSIGMGFNPNTAGQIGEVMANMGQIQREKRAAETARNNVASGAALAIAQQDPLTQMNNFHSAFDSLKQSLFDSEKVVPVLKAFAGAMEAMDHAAGAHPVVAGSIGIGGLGVGAAAAVGGAVTLAGTAFKALKWANGLISGAPAGAPGAVGSTGGRVAGALGWAKPVAGALADAAFWGFEGYTNAKSTMHQFSMDPAKKGQTPTLGDVFKDLHVGQGMTALGKTFSTGWSDITKVFDSASTAMFQAAVANIKIQETQAVSQLSVPVPGMAPTAKGNGDVYLDGKKVGKIVLDNAAKASGGGVSRGMSTPNNRIGPPRRN